MSKQPTVDILLATYNGARYLNDQLKSIEEQTFSDWRLIIRDDCSTDETLTILHKFIERFPEKTLLLPSTERAGVVANFSALMQASTAPYACFCDQDDVWDKNKIEIQLNAIRKLETLHSSSVSLLVHSDLRVVSEDLTSISNSFWKYSHLFPETDISFSRLLAQNVVTGCALLCNRALILSALPIPSQALMHDWWLALTASALGQIGATSQPTLSYRQHNANTLGAMKFCSLPHIKRAYRRMHLLASQKHAQASAFLERYSNRLSQKNQKILQIYLSLPGMSFWKSRYMTMRYRFLKQGCLRQLAAFFMLNQP